MSHFGRVQTRLPCLERAPHTTSDYQSYVMQSYNTRPNPNTEYGSIQSEAEETHTRTSQIFRQIFVYCLLKLLPGLISYVVWCGFRVSTDRLVQIEKIEYIHLMERLQKKESKKGNAANLHQVNRGWVLYQEQAKSFPKFQNVNTCLLRVKRNSELCVKI